ncbi:hypothetical protein C0Q70_17556 [Pomacea canaliculata]|uniref:Protein kinase domain-containing protein n=1 Tax=Pomacea canaliculata TaxID=400727 RepID=A0A2T7NKR8_POMCA|nr:hypothetical protein C0Q70_17556 [Pomacea canaliculata]
MEVFKMTRTTDDKLEIRVDRALRPLINREVLLTVFEANYTTQEYTPPEPGMYSIILEVGDRANNTKYVRRLCLYDPSSQITSDPRYRLYVTSASDAANYSYQSDLSTPVSINWTNYFRNALHEDNALLGEVLVYPTQLENGKKNIPRDGPLDDHQGSRTVDAIPNERGIINFQVAFAKDHNGGRFQPLAPAFPLSGWANLGLNTSYTLPLDLSPSEADTVTLWVKATDAMNNVKIERTQVTFDSTPPSVQNLKFYMNVPVPGVDFSSVFDLTVRDPESGVAYVLWTFRRSNGVILYQEKVPGKRAETQTCSQDFTKCECTTAGHCFYFNQSYAVSNCHMMVEKESLQHETITVTANVTNMAGLVNVLTWMIYFLSNIRCRFSTSECERFPHYERQRDGNLDLSAILFQPHCIVGFTTASIIGIVIGLLILATLVTFIVLFVLWRKGKVLQQGVANERMRQVSNAFDNVRRMTVSAVRRSAFFNNAYTTDGDEIYQYAGMAFNSRQKWQYDKSTLTLIDQLTEGKFASIYEASISGLKGTAVVKMLRCGFTEDDARKMMGKINFFATRLEDHEHVLKFLGAVIDHPAWGPVMVLEYCQGGQLDQWLTCNRQNVNDDVMENLFRFSRDIASGMRHLASKQIVHKRLAARNVLLTATCEVKVAGFGPQCCEGDGDAEAENTRIPIKWSAPEVLMKKPGTEKSDVWSYGIVLWEIFSMGQVPYPSLHSSDLGRRLQGGYRMDKPELADDIHHEVMRDCWQYKPNRRPTFNTIHSTLSKQFTNRTSVGFYYDTNEISSGLSTY